MLTPPSPRHMFLMLVMALSVLSARTWVSTDAGGDFALYCAAVRAADNNGNPYDLATLKDAGAPPGLTMTNPGIILPLLRPVCRSGDYETLWLITAAAAIALIGLADRSPDWLLLSAVVVAGFEAVGWMLNTGNLAVFEMLAVGIALTSWSWGREWRFGIGLGTAAFFKLLPAVFAAVPLFDIVINKDRRRASTAVAAVVVTFVALHVLSSIALPHLAELYWGWIFNDLGGFLGAEAIYGGRAHPSILSLLSDASASLTGKSWPAFPVYAAIASIVLLDVTVMGWRFRNENGARVRQLVFAAMCFGGLAVLPRVKPYSFGLVLAPLYLAAKAMPARRQIVLVTIACIVPIAAHHLGKARILEYGQLFALLGVYGAVRQEIYSKARDNEYSMRTS